MKNVLTFILLIFMVSGVQAQSFTLKSKVLGGQSTNKEVFNGFGCTGENVSPQLYWENAPEGSKSFAVTIYDADAPTGSGWWHWLVFDIPPNVMELPTGAGDPSTGLLPAGIIQSRTDYGAYGYGGPCPPEGHGLHAYTVTVYALKTDKLGLDKDAVPAVVGYYLNNNVIGKASLVFYHQR
ncbi:MAG: YbhB/YbcL family Raf kinase inhibitor-like protein [Bacteroidota bacterium]